MVVSEDKAWELVEEALGFSVDIEDDYKHFIARPKLVNPPPHLSGDNYDKIYPVSYSGYSYDKEPNVFKIHFNLHIGHSSISDSGIIIFYITGDKAYPLDGGPGVLLKDKYSIKSYLDKGYKMATLNFKRALDLNDVLKEDGVFNLLAFNTRTYIVREDKSVLKEGLRLLKSDPKWFISRLFDNVHNPLNSDWYICEFGDFYEYYHRLKQQVGLDESNLNSFMARYAKDNGIQWVERGL